MLVFSKRANHQAKKNYNNQKSFVSTSTNYPGTSRLKTQTPQILTQRTKISNPQNLSKVVYQGTEVAFSKTINFQTIKRKVIFNKNSIKRHYFQDQKQKLYRSLDSQYNRKESNQQFMKPSIQKNIKNGQIQTKNSNSSQGFFKSKIKAYGLSTYKSQNNIMNNHFMSVHLGKVKQFLLIENIDGFSTGSLVKKQLPIDVLRIHLQNSKKQNSRVPYKNLKSQINLSSDIQTKKLQNIVSQAFQQTNRKILQSQKQIHDNSGCFFSGVFIVQNQVLVSNCGTGSVFYFSKQQKFKQLSSAHDTFNIQQLQRITKSRGKIYQTEFNLKFKTQMGIKGPIRVYPNGTTYTRVLGKTFDKISKKNYKNQDPQIYIESPILEQPQMSCVNADDVQWIVVLSSGLSQFLGNTLICSIILYQIGKYGLTFTIHDLAGQCSKSIINQAIIRGFSQTISVQVIILNLNVGRLDLYEELQQKRQLLKQKQQRLKRQPKSLKYIGKRKNFIIDGHR